MIKKNYCIFAVVPGKKNDSSMIFVKKQIQSLKNKGVNIYEFFLFSRTNPVSIIKEFFRFRKLINKIKPDIIHANYGTMTSFFCAIGTLTPLVITFRGSDLNNTSKIDGYIRDFLGRFLSNISALKASNIICVSKSISVKLWWNKKKVEIIPNGVDIKLFYPLPKNIARKKLNWDMNEKVILFNYGTNSKIKRLDIAKETIEETKKYIPNVRLEILKNIRHSLIPIYINACDCLLLCSDSEGSPNIVKEAMACNLPIVSVDVGDVYERLKGVYPSKIVEQNPKKLAMNIYQILKINTRSNGRQLIESTLSEDVLALKIKSIYDNVLNIK